MLMVTGGNVDGDDAASPCDDFLVWSWSAVVHVLLSKKMARHQN